jgi:hypothetical protein
MSATQMNSCTQFSRSSTEDSPMSGNGEQPETNRTSAKRFLAHPGMRGMRNFGLGYGEACRKATLSTQPAMSSCTGPRAAKVALERPGFRGDLATGEFAS